ncbi:MAG TPA: DUF1998 domain-containing protein [Syntrophales bacterium]|nr:DUF1998 domain-containing protein [Syntrophales bacterium]
MSPRPIRRSQVIAPFGVGAMVDFTGPVSLIHCGLDAWPFDENDSSHREFRIEDEKRLSERLGVKYFVSPPDFRVPRQFGDPSQENFNLKLPFLRFPKWHVCPRCGLMYESEFHDKQAPVCRGPIGTGKDKGRVHNPRNTIQVRFVAACANGHIQDFPWWEWVFQRPDPEITGRLRMQTSGSASLAGVRILCEEKSAQIKILESRTLAGAFNFSPGEGSSLSRLEIYCRGENPALAENHSEPRCGQDLYPLLRGGSNVYFPHVVSSIYIPYKDESASQEVLEILEDAHVWFYLETAASVKGEILSSDVEAVLKKLYPDRDVSAKSLALAANRKLKGKNASPKVVVDTDDQEQAFRREEYELFGKDMQEGTPKTNLLIRSEVITDYESIISDNFKRISLVHKLRETRAFTGYSRIFPQDNLSDKQRYRLISKEKKEWLPAVIVRGEGIFLQLSEDKLSAWVNECKDILSERLNPLQETYDTVRARRKQDLRPITPRFVMLHTLSHLLINQLVYECGYGSASLRERLYCADGDYPMAGILIYTAAGDSEGTMGGLVRMGKPGRLEMILKRATENAGWCSTDPVCIESTGQGPDNCNLAACHSCALLPETSCEEQNRLLDRGLLVGTLSHPEIGFLKFKENEGYQ